MSQCHAERPDETHCEIVKKIFLGGKLFFAISKSMIFRFREKYRPGYLVL